MDNIHGPIVWAGDNKTIFYAPTEGDVWRTERVKAHKLGSTPGTDRQIFHNTDSSLFLSLGLSQSEQYLFIVLHDHQSSEVRYLSVNEPAGEPKLVAARRENIQYSMDHGNSQFYILVNDEHVNFRIATAPLYLYAYGAYGSGTTPYFSALRLSLLERGGRVSGSGR